MHNVCIYILWIILYIEHVESSEPGSEIMWPTLASWKCWISHEDRFSDPSRHLHKHMQNTLMHSLCRLWRKIVAVESVQGLNVCDHDRSEICSAHWCLFIFILWLRPFISDPAVATPRVTFLPFKSHVGLGNFILDPIFGVLQWKCKGPCHVLDWGFVIWQSRNNPYIYDITLRRGNFEEMTLK